MIKKPFFLSLLWTSLFFGLQLIIQSGSTFLGKDISSLRSYFLDKFSPLIFLQGLKIFGYIFIWIFSFSILWTLNKKSQFKNRIEFWKINLNPKTVGWCAFILLYLSHILYYPALYDKFLPFQVNKIIYLLSFYLSPIWLFYIATGLLTILFIPTLKYLLLLNPKTRIAILLSSIGFLLVNNFNFESRPESKKPNILLLSVDSLRRDRIYLETELTNLRSLYQDSNSTSFKNHYIGIPRTFPSWVETLTGKYNSKNQIRHMFPRSSAMNHPLSTFTSKATEKGYKTTVISDFAGDIFGRFQSGFSEIDAPTLSLILMLKLGTLESFPLFFPFFFNDLGISFFPETKESPMFSDPFHLSSSIISKIKNRDKKPFLITAFFSTAHFPYASPYPYYKYKSDQKYSGPFLFLKNPDLVQRETYSKENIEKIINLYDGALAAVDQSIGEILSYLKSSGQFDNTIIIITSDHGEDFFETNNNHGHGEHLWGDSVLRVPLIIKLNKSTQSKNQNIDFVTRSIDLAPTIAKIIENPYTDKDAIDGIDLTPYILPSVNKEPSPPKDPNLSAYSETGIWFSNQGTEKYQNKRINYPAISNLLDLDIGRSHHISLKEEFEDTIITSRHRSLVKGSFKLIYIPLNKKIEWELYNYKKDPNNLKNLISDPKLKNKIEMLKKELLGIMAKNEKSDGRQLLQNYILKENY